MVAVYDADTIELNLFEELNSADEPFPIDKIKNVAIQILRTLAAAHQAGYGWIDGKLEKVFVSPTGQCRLDFRTGLKMPAWQWLVKCSPTNCPPELRQFQSGFDHYGDQYGAGAEMQDVPTITLAAAEAADAWSVGVILWMLCTKKPLDKPATYRQSTFWSQLEASARRSSDLNGLSTAQSLETYGAALGVDRGLLKLISAMLQGNPSHRLTPSKILSCFELLDWNHCKQSASHWGDLRRTWQIYFLLCSGDNGAKPSDAVYAGRVSPRDGRGRVIERLWLHQNPVFQIILSYVTNAAYDDGDDCYHCKNPIDDDGDDNCPIAWLYGVDPPSSERL